MKLSNVVLPAVISVVVLVSGCASAPNNHTFSSSQAGVAQSVEWGVVQSLRPVTIQNDQRGIATGTGAVLGGIAGSTLGSGTRANTAGAVGGAVAGGAAGNALAAGTTAGVEITVKLDQSGNSLAVVQAGSPNEFRVGDKVRVTSGGGTTRVSR